VTLEIKYRALCKVWTLKFRNWAECDHMGKKSIPDCTCACLKLPMSDSPGFLGKDLDYEVWKHFLAIHRYIVASMNRSSVFF
jgi:hypothetical protein